MNRLLLVLLVVLPTIFIGAQTDTVFVRYDQNQLDEELRYEVDTLVYPNSNSFKPLIGTTVLPWTANQQNAKGYGLFLKNVQLGACEQDRRLFDEEKVLSIVETDSTLTIHTKILGNCCHDFLCDVQVLDGNKINLIYHGYGETYCSCQCCFGLSYQFSIMKVEAYHGLKFVLLNGNTNTMIKK